MQNDRFSEQDLITLQDLVHMAVEDIHDGHAFDTFFDWIAKKWPAMWQEVLKSSRSASEECESRGIDAGPILRLVSHEPATLKILADADVLLKRLAIRCSERPKAVGEAQAGYLTLKIIRRENPSLTIQQFSKLKQRLQRFRRKHEDQCPPMTDDPERGARDYLYPIPVVTAKMRDL